MRNRRTVSRYHLIRPLTGYIEHGESRHLGEIVEFSTAGFRLRLRDTSRSAFAAPAGGYDFGEIIYKQDEIGGFGDIRHVRPEGNDLLIGFKWDDIHADENIQKSFAIIAELVAAGVAGCVNIGQGQVELAGHVSAALYDDVAQCVAQGIRRISLREASSIDEGGLAMLIRLEGE
ncbi:MAG TPA: hypothetical protein VFF03_03000, partial [Rhodocyclaceae bacterium]|nr:hypothetical protein [Rhodocyclaceae bacterium]